MLARSDMAPDLFEWDEEVTLPDGTKELTHHRIIVSDAERQAALLRDKAFNADFAATIVNTWVNWPVRGAYALNPGDNGVLPLADGGVITIGPTGELYLDARRMYVKTGGAPIPAKAARLILFGKSLYGRGATDGKWWLWTGSAWEAVPDVDARYIA